MKFNYPILSACTLSLFLTLSHCANGKEQTSTTIKTCVIDSDLFPLWQAPRKEDARFPGINIELYNEIANELKFKVDWVRAPFPRCLALLGSGEVDIVNAVSYKVDREIYGLYPRKRDDVDISKRLKFDSYKAFVRKTSKIKWDGDHFSGLGKGLVLIEIGASIESLLSSLGLNVQEIASIDRGFLMLSMGRAEAVVTNGYNRPETMENLKFLTPELVRKPYYLMISKHFYRNNPDLSESIWSASAALQENRHDQIVSKYSGRKNWQEMENISPSE